MSAIPSDQYERRARCVNIVDGDTQDLVWDLGFGVAYADRIRLLGVNAPAVRTRDLDEKARGLAATNFVEEWFEVAEYPGYGEGPKWPLLTRTRIVGTKGKYGRVLARVWRIVDGRELGADLLSSGHAVVYKP